MRDIEQNMMIKINKIWKISQLIDCKINFIVINKSMED